MTERSFSGLRVAVFWLICWIFRAVVKLRESIKLRPETRSKSVVAPSSCRALRHFYLGYKPGWKFSCEHRGSQPGWYEVRGPVIKIDYSALKSSLHSLFAPNGTFLYSGHTVVALDGKSITSRENSKKSVHRSLLLRSYFCSSHLVPLILPGRFGRVGHKHTIAYNTPGKFSRQVTKDEHNMTILTSTLVDYHSKSESTASTRWKWILLCLRITWITRGGAKTRQNKFWFSKTSFTGTSGSFSLPDWSTYRRGVGLVAQRMN